MYSAPQFTNLPATMSIYSVFLLDMPYFPYAYLRPIPVYTNCEGEGIPSLLLRHCSKVVPVLFCHCFCFPTKSFCQYINEL